MKRASFGLALLLGAALVGCQEQTVAVQLRSLANSSDVSYVCRSQQTGEGRPLSECNPASLGGAVSTADEIRDLFALVTQESTGEVAVINVPLEPADPRSDEGVVDVDPSAPGFGFLRVGAQPGEIVSSPGGQASFVAVGELGKPGLFAIPTSCANAPVGSETVRDLTTWPACSLPRTPGALEMVVEPPDADGVIHQACDRSLGPQMRPASADRSECRANLTEEGGPAGRRKLLVALPEAGTIAVIDAQSLLDREPGTFEPCDIEAEYPLQVNLPPVPPEQQVPADLQAGPTCTPFTPPVPPAPPVYAPRPSALAVGDGVLYVADDAAPVIHRFDIRQPCSAVETLPLLPRSFDQPARTVTTSDLAVSPLTPSGRRFVYAVDQDDQPLPSVMVFDVSPGATDRTPVVRPGSSFIPWESPDRVRFSAAIRDITFVQREQFVEGDPPVLDTETQTAIGGTLCNPNPIFGAPGTEYQADLAQADGASVADLRGVFAMVLLSNGQISFVDVEDFDAPCRRPVEINPLPEIDFRGCSNDMPAIPGLTLYAWGTETPTPADDAPTVTNEASCRMVQPHRQRSAFLGITSGELGIHAPSLRGFPQVDLPEGAGGTDGVASRPRLLAVDFPAPGGGVTPAGVYVGTTLYRRDPETPSSPSLSIDPAVAEQDSLALPFIEPRAYVNEQVILTYEGALTGRTSAFLASEAEDATLTLTDPTVGFCDVGVNDVELMRELGAEKLGLTNQALDEFAQRHADHVAITADFPEEDDSYWAGNACTRQECEATFGDFDDEILTEERKFRIVDAEQGRLLLTSRTGVRPELTKCCFPAGSAYQIRTSNHWLKRGAESGVQHDVVAGWVEDETGQRTLECVRDCSPRKRWNDPRVFEITCPPNAPGCGAGVTVPGDACELLGERAGGARPTGVELDEPAARCIHDTPTARFAVYRGREPTTPGTLFAWSVAGGFTPLGLDLTGISQAVLPKAAVALPDMDWLTVIDSASLGLVLIELEELNVLTPTIN